MIKRLIILLLLISVSSSVFAQRFNKQRDYGARDSRFEAAFVVGYQSGLSHDVEGGSSMDVDSTFGWGLHLGWNWTANWNLAYHLTVHNPKYSAYIVPENPEDTPQTLDYEMSKGTHHLVGTYHFRDKPFTPYVQAGLGVTILDSNVPSAPPTTGCWWDPWWGYICNTTWETYKQTSFSYSLGLGLRWDVNNALFVKSSYYWEWVKVDSGTLRFDMFTLEGGLMF